MSNPVWRQLEDWRPAEAFDGVNPAISDSATFIFRNPATMKTLFEHEIEGCFLYSRHWNPSNKALATALAHLEGSEAAQVTASGMAAISSTVLQLCQAGDEVLSSRMVYGGTYALFKNFLPRLGIRVRFVNMLDLAAVEAAITPHTRVIYTESISNPLLEVADIPALGRLAEAHGITLVVDNTFSPLILAPLALGAHVVVHSLTKFINGASDCVAGGICASPEFIHRLTDVNQGASMLLGPALDSFRAASILKNLHTLPLRMRRHSANALAVAQQLEAWGLKVYYPGLAAHPQHGLLQALGRPAFGFGGIWVLDVEEEARAQALMVALQEAQVGYLAVSLGFHKTLFSLPGSSTSSEIPPEAQLAMGLSQGMIRFSMGLDEDIDLTLERFQRCLAQVDLLPRPAAVSVA